METLKDYLKRSIPEFQQGDGNLSSFLDAAGNFLGEVKESIEHFDNSKDYLNGTAFNVETTIKDKGTNLPQNFALEKKRLYLRDMTEIINKSGTIDGLVHSLKMIGFDAEIKHGWIQNPNDLSKGFTKPILTGIPQRANIGRFFFADMVYGEEYVDEDGIFFRGNDYFNINSEDILIEDIPILGQSYKNIPQSRDTVSSTPYLIILIKQGNFNIDVTDYFSEETGKTYQFTESEEFQLINDMIRFFISGSQKPTTVKYLIILFSQILEDSISLTEEFEDETHYTPDGGDDLVDFSSVLFSEQFNGTTDDVDTNIGTNFIIGHDSPFHEPLAVIEKITFGDNRTTHNLVDDWEYKQFNLTLSMDYFYPYIPTRPLIDVSFTNTTSKTISVFKSNDNGTSKVDTLIGNVLPSQTFSYQTEIDYHYIKFVQDSLGNKSEFALVDMVYNQVKRSD